MAHDYANKIRSLLSMAENFKVQAENVTAANSNPPTEEKATERRAELMAAAANHEAKAEKLMKEYRIAEEEAIAADPFSVTPISRKIVVRDAGRPSGMSGWYTQVFRVIAHHTGVRYTFSYGTVGTIATVVGYESDVRYAEYLWTAAYMMFSTRVDPVWDTTLSEAENIWRLRNAGIERRKIADSAWGANAGRVASNRSKVQRIYIRESERRGEPVRAAGLGYQTDLYRTAYAEEFVNTLSRRLREARDAADADGGLPELHGRADRVDEAFYTLFPNLRPQPATDVATPAEPCERCKKAKSGYCNEHRWLRVTAADRARWDREQNSASAQAGRSSGRDAANGVHLTRTHTTTPRLDPSGRAIES